MRFGERANPPVFRDEALREWMGQDIMHELKTDGGATFSLGRIANSSTLGRRGRPVRGPHPRDIIAQTQTLAAATADDPVRDLMLPLTAPMTASPGDSLSSAFEKLALNGVGRLAVVGEGRVVGDLSIKDGTRLLAIAKS